MSGVRASFAFVCAFACAGCVLVVDSLVRSPVEDCDGHEDGTPCVAADICVGGECVYSSCGDGYVDDSRGESCDDANLVAGDGCEPGHCRFSCVNDSQCEDGNPCTENAGCNLALHVCVQPNPISGAPCTRPDVSDGTCRMGTCAPLGCGDGTVDEGEECDDATPGCAPDCQYRCDDDRACTTSDVCEQPLVCDGVAHTCEPGDLPECDDGDECTAESCDALAGCVSEVIDADSDGYSPGDCSPESAAVGGDCDDSSPSRHPGAPEMLNGLDDDCDEAIDEDPGVTCLLDADGDGWGDPDVSMFAPACSDGWVAERLRDDCHDSNAAVHPAADAASATPFCFAGTLSGSAAEGYTCGGGGGSAPSWDFDCDGVEEPSMPSAISCAGQAVCGAVGWAGVVPGCGEEGTLRSCRSVCTVLILCTCETQDVADVAQACL
jgi:cysteine-rich repeat protein